MTPPPGGPVESASDSGESPRVRAESGSELTRALEALSFVLRRATDGQPVTSAGLKVSLQRHLDNPTFDKDLGFRTFRAFLNFAQAQGLIATRPAASDVYVYLANKAPAEPATVASRDAVAPAGRIAGRLRSDIWSAFVDFRPGLLRVYDRRGRQAWKLQENPPESEADAEATVRRRMLHEPDDFVEIPHVTRDQQLEWMRDFAQSAGKLYEPLREALSQDRPLTAFANATRTSELLRDSWHEYLVGKVKAKVSAWALEHGVSDDLTQDNGAQITPQFRGRDHPDTGVDSADRPADELLRARILAVLSDLPLEDLLRLPVPVGIVFRR